ncbi:polymorphic toxin-type HINT domain-containing protein [Gimesia aquarii]|uniref:Uncharacterized protein n=1 Tax=Gimesia aquarii TaxID=2527964 RepID=A0A517WUW5_9PLAN|nr:polymorphic toxin-type HINT domain-containing protein [Gimesia aquarii]QDU09057.1 hypothetical protein V202x_24280 [Gimesia aquarii]
MKRNTNQTQSLSFVMRLFTILLCFAAGGFCLFKLGIGQSIEQSTVAAISQSEKSPSIKQPQFKLKSVADYQVGDAIMAFNHETGQREQKTVTQTFKRQVDHLRILEFEGENGTTQTIKTTNEHPFWSSATNEYVEAKHLKPGTKLQGANGHFITVKSTRYEPHPEGITVYNVEVKGPHNYFVAANGYRGPPVLAHNTCKLDTNSSSMREAFNKAKDANGIPKSAQPLRTIKPNTPDGTRFGLDSRNVKLYEFINSSGNKIHIRLDKPATFNQGGRGDQRWHFNAGPAFEKLKQHHFFGAFPGD